jgi:Sec-independent protein secretion pathway component TatC
VLLYEVSIVMARLVQPKRKTAPGAEDPDGHVNRVSA